MNNDAALAGVIQRMREIPMLRAVIDALDGTQRGMLAEAVEWIGLPGGTVLFEQGDVARDLYVLLAGRLGVQIDRGLGPRVVHHSVPGELIGDMALIAHEPRSATVVAMRDSEVVRIPAAAAERLLATNLPLVAFLLGQLVARLRNANAGEVRPVGIERVAVVPIGDGGLDDAAAAAIAGGFASLRQKTVVIDERDGSAPDAIDADGLLVTIARERQGMWAGRSMRQADRVLFVADVDVAPDRRATEAAGAVAAQNRPADLMLVNPAGRRYPTGAAAWLGLFAPDQVFHVQRGDAGDHQRVARLVTGTAVGVVLAGGGARGFAHIGALRALGEAGIPVDLIGGTSMGGLVAASAALDRDLEEVTRKVHHAFVLNRPVSDYTLPLVSLARGRRMSALLRHHFGDERVEDCWRSFFCVSSNLTTGRAQVHREGLMWRALRATSALPGIVPPLVENGEILVDGALMNNFPVDTMAALSRGRVIGVDVAAGTVFRTDEIDIESRSVAWMLGRGRHRMPNILKLLTRAGLVASDLHAENNRAAADLLIQPDLGSVDLLSFDRYAEAIEAGYCGAVAALGALESPFV